MSIVRRVTDSYRFGGVLYLVDKMLDKLVGGNRTFGLRYKILSEADESEYPHLLEVLYGSSTGEKLHLDAPVTFNEKVQWVKIYDRNPLKTKLADKYLVREWVAQKVGEQYLVPLLGVWDSFDDIDFSKLPDQFALKLNNASGSNIIVSDKERLDLREAKAKFDRWIQINTAYDCLDLHYRDIPPKIIAEKYLCQDNNDLYDYKFMCFDGEVKYFWVDTDRYTNHKSFIFDAEGNYTKYRWGVSNIGNVPELPSNYKEMINIASRLSEGFCHVRVDLYNINGKIYFGEMTFTTAGGYEHFAQEEFNIELGSYMKLPIDSAR